MSEFKRFIFQLIGMLYIPPELSEWDEKRLLHISDTPLCLYPELKRLIEALKPDYIVHTGDMVDNIKLQLYPTSIYEHEKGIKRLAGILKASRAEIVLALGNHDDFDIVAKYFEKSRIIRESETITIEGLSFRISHLPEGIRENPSSYNLFGHDMTLKSGCIDDKLYFNGISHINVIGLESGKCISLCYPAGTDDARLGRRKLGL